ncbi:MAG: LysR family transcriptional regulator [Candidatus Dactylopiibacterium carminicum]|uniref:LysR family transcriptional regulator n=1 Tax=Candidatus Dactylopiibacterium carminicum TaxID=857335 RepID=A0A272ETC8_9RHOO|nr:LysR family transcriptional regulator [Candidatus Dactylopiibacterium carminicum]KAF7600698.1 LysR family transcriptional regulator [Candidatus Dactylopiibacterium carminicum]PAS93000.1 MAG: LysR family transcriptional regulator [Candidatus Dactylopiibacterium carminicum]PAS96548.1 MAG: LysR family transcriptional regulator [Candidatus Dactylopiibacterium carminicum]PAT00699.1 MAG: LysR family transcriptional regulator [Candidatus Dactylopiibacterium carminicum]
MIRLDDLRVFVHAARAGSFSAAARELDLSPALASGAVQRLERALGIRLFVRSTRRMRLSEDGLRYLPHAQAILDAVASGQEALAEGRAGVAGPLRLSMPSDLGRNVLLRWLDEFQQLHPRLSLHLHLSDQTADFFRDALDASVRYGQLADSSLVALPLVPDNRRSLCAAPAYLARHGRPLAPDDLRHHNCLRYVMSEHTHERWRFQLPEGVRTVPVSGDRVSDDADIVRRWAVAGLGVVYKSRLDLGSDIAAGRLVELFPSGWGQPAPLQLVAAHRSALTPVVQQLRAFLAARFAQTQAED